MKCPLMTKEGGPVISLERSDKHDALVVVWMSIDTKEYPIKGYLVFLNEQQCGAMVSIIHIYNLGPENSLSVMP